MLSMYCKILQQEIINCGHTECLKYHRNKLEGKYEEIINTATMGADKRKNEAILFVHQNRELN